MRWFDSVFCSTIFVCTLLVVIPFVCTAQPKCEGPTELIRVVVERSDDSQTGFSYKVINSYRSAVKGIMIGFGNEIEMQRVPYNTPVAIESPEGWKGKVVFPEGSDYQYIYWKAENARSFILPGSYLSGFTVIMPKNSGQVALSYNMTEAAYRVTLVDLSCIWGRVVEE